MERVSQRQSPLRSLSTQLLLDGKRLLNRTKYFSRWLSNNPRLSLVYLLLFVIFATSMGFLIKFTLDPDKRRMPWRTGCITQPTFYNANVDHLAPVDLLVGVMTVDKNFERRQVIRQTYATLTRSLHNVTQRPLGNTQVKFILGRPLPQYAERIALEMEMFNDIVVLDIKETMSSYKTLNFFRWAAEHAQVPVLVPQLPYGDLSKQSSLNDAYDIRWKLVDYVLKADDDTFIMLDELERRLRATPRTMTHWGYRVRGTFMAGELYGFSMDLVRYIASSPRVARHWHGKEDVRTYEWIKMHPNLSQVHFSEEQCWIYDHPRSWTPYAHGFLFPNHVEEIRREVKNGIPPVVFAARGGRYNADTYSTTSRWKVPYHAPRGGLTVEETIEALVEGGGRWSGAWVRTSHDTDSQKTDVRQKVVFDSGDVRLGLEQGHDGRPSNETLFFEPEIGLPVYHQAIQSDQTQVRSKAKQAVPFGINYAAEAEARKRARYLDYRVGGTVAVHYVKKNEWFWETALALVGQHRIWNQSSNVASQWRDGSSPLVQPVSSKESFIRTDARLQN